MFGESQDLAEVKLRPPGHLTNEERKKAQGIETDSLNLYYGFYLKLSFSTLTPSIFLPLYKALIRPHFEYAIQASSLILFRDCQALKSVQKLAVKFSKRAAPRPVWDSPPATAPILTGP